MLAAVLCCAVVVKWKRGGWGWESGGNVEDEM